LARAIELEHSGGLGTVVSLDVDELISLPRGSSGAGSRSIPGQP